MLNLEGTGVSSFLNFQRLLPPGHEMVGFEDETGHFYSVEDLKAIEWQEKNKMENKSIQDQLKQTLSEIIGKEKFKRQIRKCFHIGNTFVAWANDDTVWYLRRNDCNTGADFWERLNDAGVPPLPQGEEIV